ncbi:MAG TPA: lipocalin family protein [Chitinophagales bacterium]|nr:lipocalin family protein [Chitinophagales bacterium]
MNTGSMIYTVFKKWSWGFFGVQILVTFCTCNAPKNYLVNEWRVEKLQPGVDFSSSPEHLEVFKNFEKRARLKFNKDGTYNFDLAGTIQKGTWTFNRKKMTLTTTDENGKATVSKIIELKPDRLVLEQEDNGAKNILELVLVVSQ